MNRDQYLRIYQKYNNSSLASKLAFINRFISTLTFISYPILLLILWNRKRSSTCKNIVIPAASFISVSLFRHVINRKRPYEAWKIPPLISREKLGHSFPSRHVFSIFLISALWLSICPLIGFLLLLCGCILAIIRVFTGIHYVSDVIAGSVAGLLSAILTHIF